MFQQPKLKPQYHAVVSEGDGVFIVSESKHSLLHGKSFVHIVPLLDGRTSINQMVDLLEGNVSPADIFLALSSLEKAGYLTDGDEPVAQNESAYWWMQDINPSVAADRLQSNSVSLKTVGNVDTDTLKSALLNLGVGEKKASTLKIVVTDDYLRPELEEYNVQALKESQPWMLVKPAGILSWIGPIFIPNQSACWKCLSLRMQNNFHIVNYLRQLSPHWFCHAVASTASTMEIAMNIAASEVARWFASGHSSALIDTILTLDTIGWQFQRHAVIKQRFCPACGELPDTDIANTPPVRLQNQPKTFGGENSYRAVSPQETIERFQHQVSPISGAVSVLQSAPHHEGEGVFVYFAGANPAIPSSSYNEIRSSGLRSLASGKGTNEFQAKASGICEALERYSSVYRGTEPRQKARRNDLGKAAIHPNECMLFSDCQYQERARWMERKSHFNQVPPRFDDDAELEWSPAWSLTRNEFRLLPTGYCYASYPRAMEDCFCIASSNGCASGNTLEEAILQGFFELVERDSVAIWWYGRLQRPSLDLEDFDHPYIHNLRENLQRRGRSLWVLDLTSDLEIPVFVACSHYANEKEQRIIFGFGAHVDPMVALLRATSEMCQFLASLGETLPDNQRPISVNDHETVSWLNEATLENQLYLTPADTKPRQRSNFRQTWSHDLKDDILLCQKTIENQGMEMLVIDQTRPDVGLPVAKVIVPGLRHFWARFAPGRLYDVPVKLGWIETPLTEHQLNPIPLFL